MWGGHGGGFRFVGLGMRYGYGNEWTLEEGYAKCIAKVEMIE